MLPTQVTGVVPMGKNDPDAGLHCREPQLSPDPVGAAKLTEAPHCPDCFGVDILAGQARTHGCGVMIEVAVPVLSVGYNSNVELEIVAVLDMDAPFGVPGTT